MEKILFYSLSVAMLFFGWKTIESRNPIHSATFLVLSFFFMAGLFVLLHAFFLAAIQILVYAGAIMVLFLFVIMLLNVPEEEKHKLHWFGFGGSFLVGITLLLELAYIFRESDLGASSVPLNLEGTTEAVGKLLFSKYLLPFEIASVLLLATMIGVIVLSKKENQP